MCVFPTLEPELGTVGPSALTVKKVQGIVVKSVFLILAYGVSSWTLRSPDGDPLFVDRVFLVFGVNALSVHLLGRFELCNPSIGRTVLDLTLSSACRRRSSSHVVR